MRIDIQTDVELITLFNVYLPTDYGDHNSLDEFCMCLGLLSCPINEQRQISNLLGVAGDCNANCRGSRFFDELMEFCTEEGLVISDMLFLGPSCNNFTFVSAAHGTTSWLDHCLCTPKLHDLMQVVSIRFDICTSDHLPLAIALNVNPCHLALLAPPPPSDPPLNWSVASADDLARYNAHIHT